jgi:hypothetical protein
LDRIGTSMRLLTVNSHEAWLYQLGGLDASVDIVDGVPGRYVTAWDTRVRPVPANVRLVRAEQTRAERREYDCVIGHSVTDLLDLKHVNGPRLLVIHTTLEGRAENEGHGQVPEGFGALVRAYLDGVGGHAISVSALKARSWAVTDEIVPFSVDADVYPSWTGELAEGIRVANQISQRKRYLLWDFHAEGLLGVPMRLVGVDRELPAAPCNSWEELRSELARRRFFVHTADPALEDGYNMAVLEAMAAGLPILVNEHPSALVEHGVDGFVARTPAELGDHARRLLADRELAGRLGAAARSKVRERFSPQRFTASLLRAIEHARERWLAFNRRR